MSGIKGLLNLCFIPKPSLQNHKKISVIDWFDVDKSWLMLKCLWYQKKNQICPILLIIKILDQKWIFWVFLRTLVIDIL